MSAAPATPNRPLTVAVLGGTGAEGSGLALRWARAGWSVIIGSRDRQRALEAAARLLARLGPGARVDGCDNGEATARSDMVVLTVPYAAQLPTLASIRDRWRPDSILVDVTVPLATAVGGRPTRLLGAWEGSAAQQAGAAVPPGIRVVAAFHNLSAEHLSHLDQPIDSDVLVCGDDRDAKERVRDLVQAIDGARYVDAGPLANARIVEALTALLIGLNIRYKVPGTGLRITGLPG